MGLLDDAVHEFETALRGGDGRREVDCLSMLGACRMAQGAPREAVAAFRRALASPHLTREASKAIQFDLGDALEAAGERELALQCFRTVSQLDAGYRGVGGRLLALGDRGGPDDPAARGAAARKRNAGSR
jgi:tetratricopeptide (TPR) repeat protein